MNTGLSKEKSANWIFSEEKEENSAIYPNVPCDGYKNFKGLAAHGSSEETVFNAKEKKLKDK